MPKLKFQGNPGSLFSFHPDPLNPGDIVDVPADQVAGVGDDFAKPPSKTTTDPED